MQIASATNFACPIDGIALDITPGQPWRCGNGHSFDVAREGYCNLLVVQHKASRDPGDTAEMVAARRRVLDTGIYAAITEAVFARIQTLASAQSGPLRVVDAGCGDGYHLAGIADLAAASDAVGSLELTGTDVSKWAVRAAAKRRSVVPSPISWAVANNRHLPFQHNSVDVMLCLFGFPVWQGFSPVLAPDGRVVLVDPGPEHLAELRAVIYPSVTRSPVASLAAAERVGYELESTMPLTYPATLATPTQIADLFAMTPHAHRAPETGRAALRVLDQLTVTVDVVVRQLKLAGPR